MEDREDVPRQPYESPRIRKIKIVPEELAVAACKRTGPTLNTCRVGSKLVNKTHGS